MADLVRFAVGVDLSRCRSGWRSARSCPTSSCCRSSSSRSRSASSPPSRARCRPGRVKRIGPLDKVLAFPGVVQADTYLQVGETIRPVRVDGDRRGYVIAIADTNLEALERAEAAARLARRGGRMTLRLLPRALPRAAARRRRPAATGSPASTGRPRRAIVILRHDVDLSLDGALALARGRGRGGRLVDVVPDDALGLLQPRLRRGRARDRAAARARPPGRPPRRVAARRPRRAVRPGRRLAQPRPGVHAGADRRARST